MVWLISFRCYLQSHFGVINTRLVIAKFSGQTLPRIIWLNGIFWPQIKHINQMQLWLLECEKATARVQDLELLPTRLPECSAKLTLSMIIPGGKSFWISANGQNSTNSPLIYARRLMSADSRGPQWNVWRFEGDMGAVMINTIFITRKSFLIASYLRTRKCQNFLDIALKIRFSTT